MRSYYVRYGLYIAAALIVYFLLTKLLGLHQFPVLSAFNGVIFGGGIFFALKRYKQDVDRFVYQDGFQVGLFSGIVATIAFAVFMTLYIYQIDSEFAHAVLDGWNMNFNKASLILLVTLVIMGFSTSFVLTLAFMQLLKESWNQGR